MELPVYHPRSAWFPVVAALALLVLLRLGFWLGAFPNGDEVYYWLWGQRPQLSYLDHPPLLGWLQGLVSTVLGSNRLTLRLTALLATLALLALFHQVTRRLYPGYAGRALLITTLLLFASPVYFAFLSAATHDHLMLATAGWGTWAVIRYLDTRDEGAPRFRWLLLAGVLFGLAGLAKYNAILIAAGVMAAVLFSKHRTVLLQPRSWLAITVALVLVAPVLVWNWQHEFASFVHHARGPAAGNGEMDLHHLPEFVVSSLLMLSPFVAWAMVRGTLAAPAGRYRRFALAVFLLSMLFLASMALYAPVLYYWNTPGYLLLMPLAAGAFLDHVGALRRRALLTGTVAYGGLLAALLVVHSAVLPISVPLNAVDHDGRFPYGWSEVAAAVQQVRGTMPGEPCLATTDHRTAAALAWSLEDPQVTALATRRDQFDFWAQPQALARGNCVLLSDDWHPVEPWVRGAFSRLDAPLTVEVRRLGYPIRTYWIQPAYGFTGPIR